MTADINKPPRPQGQDTAKLNQKAFAAEVKEQTDFLAEMLIQKNAKYGDSALTPKRIFSKASAVEQIKVRLDDKISRLSTQSIDEDEDVSLDLLGYLILLRIAQNRNKVK